MVKDFQFIFFTEPNCLRDYGSGLNSAEHNQIRQNANQVVKVYVCFLK